MTLTFNANPSVGDVQQQPNGLQYQYDGVKWTSIGSYSTGNINDIKKLDDISNLFDDETKTFNLKLNNITVYVSSELVLNISIGGVRLDPGVDYQINTQAATITFTDAPLKGFSFTGIIESRLPTSEVDDASITTAKLTNDSVTTAKLADDSVTIHQIADNAVGSNQIAAQAIFNSDINNSAAIAQSKLNIADATTSASGYMSGADKTKLDGLDKTKLDNIESNATADQTAAEIRTLVESATDSNVFTDADHTKLNNIDVTNDRISVDSNGKFIITGDTGQYPTIRIKHSANIVEGEVFRFERTDANNARFHSLKAKSHSSATNENYLSFHIHDRNDLNSLNSQVEQLKITPNSVLLNYDGTPKAQTTATGVYITGALTTTGNINTGALTTTGNINVPVNSKIQLGDNPDLAIFHDGSNSRIQDVGTGFLLLDTNTLMIRKVDGSATMAKFVANGAAELYYAGSSTPKAQTSADGFKVDTDLRINSGSGTLMALRLQNDVTGTGTNDGGQITYSSNSHGMFFSSYETAGNMVFQTGGSNINNRTLLISNTGIVTLQRNQEPMLVATPNAGVELYFDGGNPKAQTSANGLDVTGTLKATAHIDLPDSTSNAVGRIMLGTNNHLQIFHDGGGGFIGNFNGNLNIHSNELRFLNGAKTKTFISASNELSVNLYYNGNERLSTTSTGALITGVTGSDPALNIKHSNLTVEGEVIRISRLDHSARFHSITASQSNVTSGNFIKFKIHDGTNVSPYTGLVTQLYMDDDKVSLSYDGTEKLVTTSGGITVTGSVTTQDMNMSNLNGFGNEVDNTKGSWSIQEGSDDLFLINRVNGKKYKFNLTEIN